MQIDRRTFVNMLPLGAFLAGQPLKALAGRSWPAKKSRYVQRDVDKIYDEALVIDGLLITRDWDEQSATALAQSGYTGFTTSLNSYNLQSALDSLSEWRQRISDNPDTFIYATSADDFVTAKKENKVAVLFGFQNATMIERSIENIDVLFEAGTRWIQLTYNQRNLLGDGCTERTNAGLSDFGVEAVERMNELGIIIDLSHCGRQTTTDGIKFSKTGAMFNHTMCEALYKNHPRAKTDEQIRAMADKGGVMGVICLGYMVGPDPGGETTIENYIDHIDHAVNIAGIDHVGVGTDFAIEGIEAHGATRENWYLPRLKDFKPSYEVRWPPWITQLESPERYRNVARLLDKRGYKTVEIEKILGGNLLRYFRETLKP